MLLDLEAKEIMDGSKGFRIFRRNLHTAAARHGHILLGDIRFEALHRRDARRHLVVDKHRDIEVTFLETPRNVLQVMLDGIAARGVRRIVGGYLNSAARRILQEMVGRLRRVEAHAVIAAGGHVVMVLVLRGILGA